MALAFFHTWTTYGAWLPGDERGWYQKNHGLQDPDAQRKLLALIRMTENVVSLNIDQRQLVEEVIRNHCRIRCWCLHAINCRSNHVHVVVSAPVDAIEIPRLQFKSWCSRRLREQELQLTGTTRKHWWTDRGWDIYLDTEEHLNNAIAYVRDGQDFQK